MCKTITKYFPLDNLLFTSTGSIVSNGKLVYTSYSDSIFYNLRITFEIDMLLHSLGVHIGL